MSSIMIVLDGMQDISYPELGGLTPYEKGRGEHFGRLEASCVKGRLVTTPPGYEPDTQVCVLALLGVEPRFIPEGRSYIEALAVGLEVGEGDMVMRCNFVKLSDDGLLEIPCCSAPEDIAKALRTEVAALDGHTVIPVGTYKSLQLIKGAGSCLEGLIMDMPHQNQGKPYDSLLPRGNALADSLAEFSREMYRRYAPYTVLNWAPAVKTALPAFSELYPGITGAMVSKTDAPIGIAAAMGMECPALPAATGDTDTDLNAKVNSVLELTNRHDFVLMHVGGPDEATHRQDASEKAAFIARLDSELIGPVLERCPDGTRIMVTSDHEGICSTAGHTDKPVEFFLYEIGRELSGDIGTRGAKEAVGILLGKSR